MRPSERVRRHGYHLMSLASVGQLVCVFFWLMALIFGWELLSDRPGGADPHQVEFWLVATMASLALLGELWALNRLHAIGKLLHGGSLIDARMARAWRVFGRALIVAGVLHVVTLNPMPDWTGNDLSFGVDMTEIYFILIACLISYSIAWILDEAVALKDDNQGIV